MFKRVVNEDGLRSFFATRQNQLEGYAIEIEKGLEGPVNERNIDPPECPDSTFDERPSLEELLQKPSKCMIGAPILLSKSQIKLAYQSPPYMVLWQKEF